MYTYKGLGGNGRLGNQMFQYATLLNVAKINNEQFSIPTTVDRHDFRLDGQYEIIDAFPNLTSNKVDKESIEELTKRQYVEPGFKYDPNVKIVRSSTDLHGYFQSELYFQESEDQIRKEYVFSKDIRSSSKSKMDDIRTLALSEKLCAVHIRRTDYKNNPDYHTNLDSNYYNPAIQGMMSTFPGIKFVIFSDDIEWCKQNMPPETIFSTAADQYEDMCMMSMCDTHIIANSSFSWWASWLGKSELTVAPKQWFGSKGPGDWSTIYRTGWYLI